MVSEIALFWAVLFGFLLADNLVLVPAGGEHLRFGRDGRLRYRPGVRFQLRGRDLVLLNPLNPFDRIALATRALGPLAAPALREARRRVRGPLRAANRLAALGALYLLLLAVLALASARLPFIVVLLALALVHLLAWFAAIALLLWHRGTLGLARPRLFGLAAEALFVPAYTANLGKRIWYGQVFELPAMVLGLRELRRLRDPAARELYAYRLGQRIDELPGAAEAGALRLDEVRACLKASTESVGS